MLHRLPDLMQLSEHSVQ